MAVRTPDRIIHAAPPAAAAMAGNGAAVAETTDAAIQKLLDDWRAKLTEQTEKYVKAMAERKKGGAGLAEPVAGGYPFWNLIIAGPFQTLGGAGGPFLPGKIAKGGEEVVFLGALWRNPVDIPSTPGISSALLMSGYDVDVTFQSVDLTTVMSGPGAIGGAVHMHLAHFPPAFLDLFAVTMIFPAVAPGAPHLYEVNAVADVTGPDGMTPFAGYSTWIFNPDTEPPFLGLPEVGPHLTYDQPARILIYA